MPKIAPPHIVRTLMARGCMANFGPGGNAFNPDESVALVRYLTRLLQDRTADSGDALVETLMAVAGASMTRHRPDQPLACARGCASCCHQYVAVSAVEAFAIARRLRRAKDVAAHRARLDARPARGVGDPARLLDQARRCAFLDDAGGCGIHAFRPLACRVYASLDVRACLRRFEAGNGLIPWPSAHEPIHIWLSTALWTAHRAAGLTPRTYELTAAVDLVLHDPGLEARWYAGDDGLAAAANPPLPDPVPGTDQLRALARL